MRKVLFLALTVLVAISFVGCIYTKIEEPGNVQVSTQHTLTSKDFKILGRVSVTGETRSWTAATDHRHFCPACGSSLFATNDGDGEVEVRLGALDEAPSGLAPAYELWTPRREHWQRPVAGAAQHTGNRP